MAGAFAVGLLTVLYGGPQVLRQKFEVNTTQLNKLRQHLFFICDLSLRQALLLLNARIQDFGKRDKRIVNLRQIFVNTMAKQ